MRLFSFRPGSWSGRRAAAVLVGLLVAASVVSPAAGQSSDERVLARVNDTPITVSRFTSTYVLHIARSGQNDTPESRAAHLGKLIEMYLFADEARRRDLEDEAYEAFVDRKVRKSVGGRYFETVFADSLPRPTDAEVREAYRKSKERVVLRHLFFRDPVSADSAHARLQRGEVFVALANEVFQTASFDSTAGFLGDAGYWQLDDAVAEAAFSLPVGGHSAPVRSRYGWHILRLENKVYQPLLTESEYQVRRDGIESQLWQRRFRLEGDRFVRGVMQSLEVTVDPEGIEALTQAVARVVEPEKPEAPNVSMVGGEVTILPADVEELGQILTPETPLATYRLEGREVTFTAGDYLRWIEELPGGEVRNRTAASVGRALRNEAFAQLGLAAGYSEDPLVVDEVRYQAAAYLADELREQVRQTETATPTAEEVEEAFLRLGYRRLKEARATYWTIPFTALADARAVRDAIASGSAEPAGYGGYRAFEDASLTGTDELTHHVQRAPEGAPVLIGTADGTYHVAYVKERTLVYTQLDEVRAEIERLLATYLPELRLAAELQRRADVEVDPELFDEVIRMGEAPKS